MMKRKRKLGGLFAVGLLGCTFALTGCDGGDDGAPGAAGAPGKDGVSAAVAPPSETCVACHGTGRSASVATAHAIPADITVSAPVVTTSGADLVVNFNIKSNGANKASYYDAISSDYRLNGANMERRDLSNDGTAATLSGGASGNYTVTIAGGATAYGSLNSRYMIRLQNTADAAKASADRPSDYRAIVQFDYPASPVTDVLGAGSTSCANCHGPAGNGFHYGYPSNGGKNCVVCHDATNTTYPKLPYLIHGIHNSHEMPSGKFVAYGREAASSTGYKNPVGTFSIGFPSDMRNCKNCHTTDAALTAVMAKPVSYDYCMSCHENWDGFTDTKVGGTLASLHRNQTSASNCALCHDGATAPANVAGFHDGQLTVRSGLLKGGKDLSVEEGKNIIKTITGVTSTTAGVTKVTWTATKNGVAVDPCNTATTADGAVSFQPTVLLRAYAEGNDWTNKGIGATPGQPTSELNVFTGTGASTTCASNVATTTLTGTAIQAPPAGATKGLVGLAGKPNVRSATAGTVIAVRSPSVTREYTIATGAEPAAASKRRQIVDTAKCLKCHEGTLYQHGGSRIDNVEYCVICHNPASSEKWYRTQIGLTDPTKAYDGKVGQTIDFRYMLHAIHSAGENGNGSEVAIAFYRSNGIYVFGASDATIPNWPGTGAKTTYGSKPAGTDPNGTTLTHNFIPVHYPRPLNDCMACHVSTASYAVTDLSKAVGVSVNDAGAAPWTNQDDDILVSPTTAACMSCHRNTNAATNAGLLAHAYQNSWIPQAFTTGRQYILDLFK